MSARNVLKQDGASAAALERLGHVDAALEEVGGTNGVSDAELASDVCQEVVMFLFNGSAPEFVVPHRESKAGLGLAVGDRGRPARVAGSSGLTSSRGAVPAIGVDVADAAAVGKGGHHQDVAAAVRPLKSPRRPRVRMQPGVVWRNQKPTLFVPLSMFFSRPKSRTVSPPSAITAAA